MTTRLFRRALATILLVSVACSLALAMGCARATRQEEGEEQGQGQNLAAWSEADAPDYYQVVGPANIGNSPEKGSAYYEPLDALGRAQGVVACVDTPLMESGSARERQDMRDVLPSGWGHNDEASIELPTGETYHGYFWNRSHLLAKSLGGTDELENLVCGTRMQNVGANTRGHEGGMAYIETLVRDWLHQNPEGFVHYRATPVYSGREAVCRYVVVDALSSDGTLDIEVLVFNAAKGFAIDYETGTFEPTSEPASAPER